MVDLLVEIDLATLVVGLIVETDCVVLLGEIDLATMVPETDFAALLGEIDLANLALKIVLEIQFVAENVLSNHAKQWAEESLRS